MLVSSGAWVKKIQNKKVVFHCKAAVLLQLQIQDSFSGDAYQEASILGVTQLHVELLELSFWVLYCENTDLPEKNY